MNWSPAAKRGGHTILALAEYWTDGRRTALDIVEQIELETGFRDAELIVRQFELLLTDPWPGRTLTRNPLNRRSLPQVHGQMVMILR